MSQGTSEYQQHWHPDRFSHQELRFLHLSYVQRHNTANYLHGNSQSTAYDTVDYERLATQSYVLGRSGLKCGCHLDSFVFCTCALDEVDLARTRAFSIRRWLRTVLVVRFVEGEV